MLQEQTTSSTQVYFLLVLTCLSWVCYSHGPLIDPAHRPVLTWKVAHLAAEEEKNGERIKVENQMPVLNISAPE